MTEFPPLHNAWYLTGATATGKTRIALALARAMDAEILSLDSMAIYRGMDIGTAKPTPEHQAQIPHHLLDLVEPEEEFSVAQYLQAAHARAAEIHGRGKEVLFVGGTPLYLKALLRGLFQGPPADWDVRRQIEREIADVGTAALHERLQQVDPVAASLIHAHDARRLVRALEVYRATGQPISHRQLQFDEGRLAAECRVFVLQRPRPQQHVRISHRVVEMFQRGLIDEVQRLTSGGRSLGRTASQAVGYRETMELLAGKFTEREAIERIQARTRRFAKRQETWFRSLSECRFVPIEGEPDPEQVAKRILHSAGTTPASDVPGETCA